MRGPQGLSAYHSKWGDVQIEGSDLRKYRFEIIGDAAVVDIPLDLAVEMDRIAQLVAIQSGASAVLRRQSRRGPYRVGHELILGDSSETTVRENHCVFRLDLAESFFSPRLASERLRIARLAGNTEKVLCLFAGVGAYPITIAKHTGARVWAVELNPLATRYMRENIVLNKVEHLVEVIEGDVSDVVPPLGEFDRVVAPAPLPWELHADLAISATHGGGVLHYYLFASGDELPKLASWAEAQYPLEVLKVRRCGSYAPGVYRVVVDARRI